MWDCAGRLSGPGGLRRIFLEQCDLQIACPIDYFALGREPAVRDAEHEFRTHDPFDLDAVDDFPDVGQHLSGKLELPEAERTTASRGTGPAQEEADHLPQCVESEAAGHHRITFEMTGEKPQVGPDLEHRATCGFS